MSAADAQRALDMILRAKAAGRAADLTFRRAVAGEYDPEAGSSTTELSWGGIAVVLPASKGTIEAFDQRVEGGTLIESNLRALIIAAQGMERAPAPQDLVVFADGSVWTLLGCTSLDPDATTPIIYRGTVKR